MSAEAVAREPRRGTALFRVTAHMAMCQTPGDALDEAAQGLRLVAIDSPWLAVARSGLDVLVRASADAGGVMVQAGEALLARLARDDCPYVVLDRSDAETAALLAVQRLAVAPVAVGGAVAGALAVGLRAGVRVSATRREQLVLLAHHLGAVLSHLAVLQELRERTRQLLATYAQLEAYARDMRVTYEAEREHARQLRRAYEDLLRVLATAIEERDDYTGGHIRRVAAYSVAIGRELGLPENELHALEMGAILHDIGKIAITDAILRKRGGLRPLERAKMREHPEIGARMLEQIPFLRPALDAVLAHHERVDGRGYPRGLAGDQIPLVGRIVAVADAFDAMTTTRPYRPARAVGEALAELRREAGRQLDPAVVAAFERAWRTGKLDGHLLEIGQRSVS